MKKIFLPFSFVLLLASCGSETAVAPEATTTPLTACECAEIYANNPTLGEKANEEDRKALNEKWNEMWAPCEGIDMSEVLKCK
jgi:hypothetical protein